MVFSLLAIYLSVSLVDIFYLHPYNPPAAQPPKISINAHIDTRTGGPAAMIEFHRLFKTIITNKNSNRLSITLVTVLSFLIVSKFDYDKFGATQKPYTNLSLYFHPSLFLNLCTLRI